MSDAASATTSPSLRLHPRSPGGEGDGEGEGPKNLTDRGVAVGNRARPHLPPPLSSSASPPLSRSTPLSLLCCSQSASRRPEREAGRLMRGQAQGEIMKQRRMEGGRNGGEGGDGESSPHSKHAFC